MADPKKVATPAQREVVIGAAAKALETAAVTVKELLDNLRGNVADLGLKIEEKQLSLNGLEQQYAEKDRQAQVNLALNIQEKGLVAAEEVLGKQNKVSIDKMELTGLKAEVNKLKADYTKDLQSATEIVVKQEKAKWDNEKALLQAQHKQEQAENTAAIKGAELQVKMLADQAAMLTKQLNDERDAGVRRMAGIAAPVVNVGNQR